MLFTYTAEILKIWSENKGRRAALVCKAGAAAVCFVPTGSLLAQEALRMSMTGELAAAARRDAASTLGYYNLKLGPTLWTLVSGLGVGYTDNVALQGAGTGGDLFFTPEMGAQMRMPVTDKNSLDFGMNVGYMAYTKHSNLDRFFISPGSELSFDMFVDNVVVNFHDRPSISQYAYQDPTLVGGNYVRFENQAGLAAKWDMNRITLNAGFDHVNYQNLGSSSGGNYPDGQSEVLFMNAGYVAKPARIIGLESGVSFLVYDFSKTGLSATNQIQGGTQSSLGAYYTDRLTDHIQVQAHAGYTFFSPDLPPTIKGDFDTAGPYLSLTLTHQINERIRHSLSGGRIVTQALYGGNYTTDFLRWQADWRVIHKVSLSTPLALERWSQSSSVIGATDEFNRVTAGITLSRPLGQKLGSSLGYQFYWRDAGTAKFAYTVNTFTLSFNYKF